MYSVCHMVGIMPLVVAIAKLPLRKLDEYFSNSGKYHVRVGNRVERFARKSSLGLGVCDQTPNTNTNGY